METLGDFNPYKYAEELVTGYPTITEIWLYGSRANNLAREDSDWDILVLADDEVFQSLLTDVKFNHSKVDLVVAPSFAGDYRKPWGENNTIENFGSLRWHDISDREASYYGEPEWVDDPGQGSAQIRTGQIEEVEYKAFRLWPKR
jgi:predicted nucleotidyltransferase